MLKISVFRTKEVAYSFTKGIPRVAKLRLKQSLTYFNTFGYLAKVMKRNKVSKERKVFLFKKEKLIIKRKKHCMLFIYAGFRPRIFL